jgi:hypothetical protein
MSTSLVGIILIVSASAVALASLLVAAFDDRKRRQRIADQQWRDVEGE